MVHNACASGGGQQFISEAYEAAGRNGEFHSHVAGDFFHGNHFCSSRSKTFHNGTHEFLRNFNGQTFEWFALLAVDFLVNNLRLGNFEFKALTAHGFNQDGQVKFAAAGYLECVGCISVFYAESHVGLDFLVESCTDVAGGDEVAFSACERTLVDMEYHGQGRFVDMDSRKSFRISCVSNGFADVDVFEAGHSNDVAHLSFGDRCTFHSLPVEESTDVVGADLFTVSDGNGHALLSCTAGNTADSDFAEVVVSFKGGDHDLQSAVSIAFRAWAVLQDGIEERSEILSFIIHMEFCNAASCGCINEREIKLFVSSVEFHEQFKDFPFYIADTLIRTVNLIDDNDRFQFMFKGLAQYVLRLRHRAFVCVYQKKNAVNHVEDTFYFAAEIGMPWGVDDIDFYTVMHHGCVLGEDGDSSFSFQRIRVHDTFSHFLVVSENMALLQHGIYESRFTMVDMRDNGNVTNTFSFHFFPFPPRVLLLKTTAPAQIRRTACLYIRLY